MNIKATTALLALARGSEVRNSVGPWREGLFGKKPGAEEIRELQGLLGRN